MAALAGANLIYGAGMTESGVTFDYAQYVLDNDIARMVKHAVQGVPVNDETLDIDDIHAVGSFGDYMSLDSTFKHMRELSQPRFMDRRVREDWQAMGAQGRLLRRQGGGEADPRGAQAAAAARRRGRARSTPSCARRRCAAGSAEGGDHRPRDRESLGLS